MAVQGEDTASRIEARIKEAIDSVVEDIRVSLDDVREVVNSQFDAALQSVLADAKSLTLRGELEEMLSEMQVEAPAAVPATAPPAPASTGLQDLKKAIQEIEKGGTQVDVLNALLDQLLEFGSRAALLILKGDTFSGWKGKGFAASGGNDELIKRFTAGPGEVPELDRARIDERVVAWNGASFAQRANMAVPVGALAVPMVIKDKIAATVYVDRLGNDDPDLDQNAIELLVFTTGLLIDTLAIRKKIPSPTLSRERDAEPFEADAEPLVLPQHTETKAPQKPAAPAMQEPAPRTAPSRPETPPAPPARPNPPTQVAPPQPQTPPAAAPAQSPRAQSAQPSAAPQTPPAAPAPSIAPPAANGGGEAPSTQVRPPAPPGAEGGSTQYVPPPGVKGGFAAKADLGEDAKKHDDARRFARLLVSEIKLYNEGKVDQGRKNGDLYERLKEDIDRSRQMYEDRVPQEVREVSNYFYDELVRILADGNTDALGL